MNIINKYVWLVETIYRAHKISFEYINRKWLDDEDFSEGVEIPLRTFHKWRIAVEEMFGLVIENEKRGEYRYYIENEDVITKGGMRSWMLNTISTSNLLLENRSLSDRILLEDIPSGREYLQPIIEAMKKNRLIHFTYYNYWRDDYRQHCVEPYCVKLFRQRWYMVGKMLGANVILVYSLDRMSEFRKSERTFKYPDDFDGEYFFKDCYGIIAGDGTKLEHVVMKVSAGQANYMRDLPMHQSQRETEQTDEYSIFELDIRPTYDLYQEVLRMGTQVEVLEPNYMREEIIRMIETMYNQYKKMRIKMEHNTLLESYKNIVTKFLDKIEDEQFQDLVTRGLVISKNKAKQPILLLSGINPSFNDKENDRQDVLFTFAEAKDHGRSKYWGKKHNQFGGKYSKLVQENMAYLDLFPLKETKQLRFERVLRPYNDFRMELLVETQKEIEKINPKLIVHANKTSLYYWGLNPITYTKDSVNTWMNYDFEEINFRDCPPLIKYSQRVDTFNVPKEKRFVHFYKISGNGFVDGNHYFLAYVMEYYGMKDWQKVQLLTPIEMTELWEWCKKNKI